MSSQHLFACPNCETSFVIDTTQAGQPTSCPHCDASVTLPTLRKIRELPIVEQTSEKSSQALSFAQRSRFAIGLGLAILGLGTSSIFFYLRSQLETEIPPMAGRQELVDFIAEAPIDSLWQQWKTTVRGTELAEWMPSPIAQERKTARLFFGVAVSAGLVGALGVGLAGWGLLGRPTKGTDDLD